MNGKQVKKSRRTAAGMSFKEAMTLYFFIERENEASHASGVSEGLGDMNISVILPDGYAPLSISRRWSRQICEKLVKDGFLTYDERIVPRQKEPVKYYKIIENLETLRELAPRVMPLFGSHLIRKRFVQKILEEELIGDLENHYSVQLNDEARVSILTLVLASTKALDLALRRPELPPSEESSKKSRSKRINRDLVGVLLAALVTDLSERGLRWREDLVDRIDLGMQASFKIGEAEGTIESSLSYVSQTNRKVLDELKGRSS